MYGRKKFTSKRRRGRKGGKSSPWYDKKYSAVQLARKAWDGVWRLKGLVNSEVHKNDMNSGLTTIPNTGVIDSMVKIAVGDTYADRTGNSVYARSLNIKGVFALGASETQSFIRMAVVIDTQQIGDTNPAFTDIYEAASSIAHLNPATVGRFKVLKDLTYVISSGGDPIKGFEINLPMRHHVRFNGTANTDIQKGAIYLVYTSSMYVTNPPTVLYRARLSFHDN